MDAELERFRQEVTRLQAGKVRSSVRYPETLRGFAVRYATEALKRGVSRTGGMDRVRVGQADRPGELVSEPLFEFTAVTSLGSAKRIHAGV
ncbi:hypothetical protein [Myxococcus qinghaiensis]|uniref:hypothetical protein n=1 Tax=Myxococcus qinghaiensis TaxID=2906758 RepID=UPI0020A6EA45|nr:hypothetical protein [Myxococcus qinghaiensis]MCP3170234.1 hypothetical protein [Myxococcus qinghaiensis]